MPSWFRYKKRASERLRSLEGMVETQDKQIKMLASLLYATSSSRFDGPLKRFFDDAGRYFDYFYETNVPCYKDCSERWKRSDKGEQAKENLADCKAQCAELLK